MAITKATGPVLGNYPVGTGNVALGDTALDSVQTGGDYNVAIGNNAGTAITTGDRNVVIGASAGDAITTSTKNIAVGTSALTTNSTGDNNVAIGKQAGREVTSGGNLVMLGNAAGNSGSPGGSLTSGNNEMTLGNGDHSKINVQVSLTVASDERDKTDFQPLSAGLDFVNQLKPYTYYWDKRHKYIDWDANPDADLNSVTHDGTHKEDWLDLGFKAQDVVALEESINHNLSDKTNLVTSLSDDGKQYALQYEKFVPILVKAVQELSAKVEELEKH